MNHIIKGKAWIFSRNNIDTDQIYPGRYLELTEHEDIAKHVMEGVDAEFAKKFIKGGIIVGGDNFGCGSSREHAAIALKTAGISAVIARSFARIFYRNAINVGLPVLTCKDAIASIEAGDALSIDMKNGKITDIDRGLDMECDKLSEQVLNIIEKGGVIPLYREKLGAE